MQRRLFSKFVFYLAADVFPDVYNIRARRLPRELSPHGFFQHVILRKFSHNKLKLCVRDPIVSQCFGKKPVNRFIFRNGKSDNLLMSLNQAFYWQLSGLTKPSETPANATEWNCSRQSRAKANARKRRRKSARACSAPINKLFSPFVFFVQSG